MRTKQLPISVLLWLFWILTISFVVVSRWIYKSQYLFHNDSVQFALALNELDVTKHQPHPPGYILYVWLAKLANYFVDDPNVAFVIVGILATIVGLVAIYYLAKDMFGQVAGYLAGFFYITNASVWFHGLVAEVYIVEVAFVLVALVFIHRFWKDGSRTDLILMMLFVALVGGVRQTAELFILPVAIYAIFVNQKVFFKYWKESAGIWLTVNLLWAIPLIYFSGGVAAYFKSLAILSSTTVIKAYATQSINVLIANGSLLWQAIKQAVLAGLFILFLALLPFIASESRARYPIRWGSVKWWLWAFIPGIVFLQLILMRNPGYGLYFIVLLIVLMAGSVVLISRVVDEWRKLWGTIVATILVVAIIGSQVFGFFRTPALHFEYTSAALPSIEWVETIIEDLVSYLQGNFEPESSIIFVIVNENLIFFGVRHFQFYLSDFDIYSYRPLTFVCDDKSRIWHTKGNSVSEFIETIDVDDSIKHIVYWGDENLMPRDDLFIKQKTPDGHTIGYFDLTNPETRQEIKQDKQLWYLKLLNNE